MSAPSAIETLRDRYKLESLELRKISGDWAAKKSWARRLYRERGDHLGQVSKAMRVPAGLRELERKVRATAAELVAAERAARQPLDGVLLITTAQAQLAEAVKRRHELGCAWALAGGGGPVPADLLAAEQSIVRLRADIETTATKAYEAQVFAAWQRIGKLTSFYHYLPLDKELQAELVADKKKLDKEHAELDNIFCRRKPDYKPPARGFRDWLAQSAFTAAVRDGTPILNSPFLVDLSAPASDALQLEDRLRVADWRGLGDRPPRQPWQLAKIQAEQKYLAGCQGW